MVAVGKFADKLDCLKSDWPAKSGWKHASRFIRTLVCFKRSTYRDLSTLIQVTYQRLASPKRPPSRIGIFSSLDPPICDGLALFSTITPVLDLPLWRAGMNAVISGRRRYL